MEQRCLSSALPIAAWCLGLLALPANLLSASLFAVSSGPTCSAWQPPLVDEEGTCVEKPFANWEQVCASGPDLATASTSEQAMASASDLTVASSHSVSHCGFSDGSPFLFCPYHAAPSSASSQNMPPMTAGTTWLVHIYNLLFLVSAYRQVLLGLQCDPRGGEERSRPAEPREGKDEQHSPAWAEAELDGFGKEAGGDHGANKSGGSPSNGDTRGLATFQRQDGVAGGSQQSQTLHTGLTYIVSQSSKRTLLRRDSAPVAASLPPATLFSGQLPASTGCPGQIRKQSHSFIGCCCCVSGYMIYKIFSCMAWWGSWLVLPVYLICGFLIQVIRCSLRICYTFLRFLYLFLSNLLALISGFRYWWRSIIRRTERFTHRS
eukprot:g33819.t1